MEVIKLRSSAILSLDEKLFVWYSSDFKLCLGRITEEYRFVPTNLDHTNEGFTPEILSAIADLIRMKAGIGEKRDVPPETDEEKGEDK